MEIWTIWLIVAGVFTILEMITEGFLVLWLGVGALLSMAFSIFYPEMFAAQVIIWCVSSILLIACTKKFVIIFFK